MTDIVFRMRTLPDLTNEKAWEVVYAGANEIMILREKLRISEEETALWKAEYQKLAQETA